MDNEQYLLSKLAEEASEIAQIALKASQFGLNEVYIDETNRKRIFNELNDLLGVVELMNHELEFGFTPDKKRIEDKAIKIHKYRFYSYELGRYED